MCESTYVHGILYVTDVERRDNSVFQDDALLLCYLFALSRHGVFNLVGFFITLAAALIHLYMWVGDALPLLVPNIARCTIY